MNSPTNNENRVVVEPAEVISPTKNAGYKLETSVPVAEAEVVQDEEVSPEIKAMQDELANIKEEDPEQYLQKSQEVLEKHTFKDVFKVFSAMYDDANMTLQAMKEGKVPPDNADIVSMLKDSFDLEALKKIYVDEGLVKYRKDAKYFSRAAYKKTEKAKDGAYERLKKKFEKSSEKFPDIRSIKNIELIPDMTKNIWRHLVLALDALVTKDGWTTRARYVKQIAINCNLVGLFYKHGGEALYSDEEVAFNCMKHIIPALQSFNDTVLTEISNHPEI